MTTTTKEDVATLLENFADYINHDGKLDPWFSLNEINRQFAWEDIPKAELTEWLDDLINEGLVEVSSEEAEEDEALVWRWLS